MPGLTVRKQVGDIQPAYSPNGTFRRTVQVQDGILERLDFFARGTHATLITAGGQTDGELNIFSDFRVIVPRKNLPDVVWNVLPRDLKHITTLFNGQQKTFLNPLADAGVHQGRFSVFFALPPHLSTSPFNYGIDTNEIDGDIVIEGTYGPVTSIGPSATAIVNDTTITAVTRKRRRNNPPLLILTGNLNRISNDSDARIGPTPIGTAAMDGLYALYLRLHDNSATSADRPNGLVTRFIIEHNAEMELVNELFDVMQQETTGFFGLALADLLSGIAMPVFANGGDLSNMPLMSGSKTLQMTHDSLEVVPAGVTNVTPASNDAVFTVPIGVQLTAQGVLAAAAAAA